MIAAAIKLAGFQKPFKKIYEKIKDIDNCELLRQNLIFLLCVTSERLNPTGWIYMTAHLQDNAICQRAMEESATQTSFRRLRARHSDTDIQIFTESAKLSSLFRA